MRRERPNLLAAIQRAESESGFTLIELLIAMVIVGLLATIALGSLLSTRFGASDASAKQMLNTAGQAATTYSFTNGYAGMTPAALKAVEPSLNTTANGQTVLVNAAPTLTGYLLTVVSSSADTFNMTNANGITTRTCTVASGVGSTATNTGGGCNKGTW